MNLLFQKKISPGKSLNIPFGVKSAKIRCDPSVTIKGVGICSTAAINSVSETRFPIIQGKSPCKFENISDKETTITFSVQEIGGIPDPYYFSDSPTVIPDESTEQEVNNDAV